MNGDAAAAEGAREATGKRTDKGASVVQERELEETGCARDSAGVQA